MAKSQSWKSYFKSVKEEFCSAKLWVLVFTEFLATLFLCSGVVNAHITAAISGDSSPGLRFALAVGAFVIVFLESFLYLGAGLMNPLFSICFLILRKISVLKTVLYILAEIIGGVVALQAFGSSLNATYSGHINPVVVPADIPISQAFFMELYTSFILVWVAVGAIDHRTRAPVLPTLTVGLCAIGLFLSYGSYSCMLNPVYAFGLASFTGDWTNQWMYWVAGCLASVLATSSYQLLYVWEIRKMFGKKQKNVDEAGGGMGDRQLSLVLHEEHQDHTDDANTDITFT